MWKLCCKQKFPQLCVKASVCKRLSVQKLAVCESFQTKQRRARREQRNKDYSQGQNRNNTFQSDTPAGRRIYIYIYMYIYIYTYILGRRQSLLLGQAEMLAPFLTVRSHVRRKTRIYNRRYPTRWPPKNAWVCLWFIIIFSGFLRVYWRPSTWYSWSGEAGEAKKRYQWRGHLAGAWPNICKIWAFSWTYPGTWLNMFNSLSSLSSLSTQPKMVCPVCYIVTS